MSALLLPVAAAGAVGAAVIAARRNRGAAVQSAPAPVAPLPAPVQGAPELPVKPGPGGVGGAIKMGLDLAKTAKSAGLIGSGGGAAAGAGGLGAGGIAAIVVAGGVAEGVATRTALSALGANKATQDYGTVAPFLGGPPVAAGLVARELLKVGGGEAAKALGIKATDQQLNQAASTSVLAYGAAVVGGGPAVIGFIAAKAGLEAGSAVLGAVAGKETELAVRGAVSQFDPTRTGSAASNVIGGVVDTVGGAVGGLLGIKPPPPKQSAPPASPAELQRVKEALARSGGAGAFLSSLQK